METFLIPGLIFSIIFFYFHIHRPPRSIHNEEDLQASLNNISSHLEYDVITCKLKNPNTSEDYSLYIICDPIMSQELEQLFKHEIGKDRSKEDDNG